MQKVEFDKILKDIDLSRKRFAKLTNLTYGAVSNWNDSTKPIPGWVESWLENYIKAKSYKDIKNKVLEIENIKP